MFAVLERSYKQCVHFVSESSKLMKFTPKLAVKLMLSDTIVLYSIYFFVGALIMAESFKYYESNSSGFFLEGLKISSALQWFCVFWLPILFVICICRLSAIKAFIESGTEIWGRVTEIRQGSGEFKKLARVTIGYIHNEVSYLTQKEVRLVRQLKHLNVGNRIHLVIDPKEPTKVLLIGVKL
jgi:hypothetical protein